VNATERAIKQEVWDEDEGCVAVACEPEIPEEFYRHFHNCAVILARHYLSLFFEGKKWHSGGPVPKALLYSPQIVSMVLNTTQIEGIDGAYELMTRRFNEREKYPEVTDHMIYVLKLIHECEALGVPTCFRGGMLLASLKFCQGIPLHGW